MEGNDYFSTKTRREGSLSPIITNTSDLSLEDDPLHKRPCHEYQSLCKRAFEKGHSLSLSDNIKMARTLDEEVKSSSAMEMTFQEGFPFAQDYKETAHSKSDYREYESWKENYNEADKHAQEYNTYDPQYPIRTFSGNIPSFSPRNQSETFNTPAPHPTLKKQLTLPTLTLSNVNYNTIKNVQTKRMQSLQSVDYSVQISDLSSSIHYESQNEFHTLLGEAENLLVIDIRPFTDYVQSHLTHALNICIPSTLLKRPTFSLARCISSLPAKEKQVMNTVFNRDDKATIIIYDHEQNTSNLYHVCNKFKASDTYDDTKHSIHLVNVPISVFREQYPQHFESSGTEKEELQDENMLPPIVVDNGTPILQKFVLPKSSGGPVPFKIRHNEELMTGNPFEVSTMRSEGSSTLNQNKLNFFKLKNLPADPSVLPVWLRKTIYGEEVKETTSKINADFFALEKLEQSRLVNALFLDKSRANSIGGEEEVKISRGIEFGHKNRYKDIFLFEHSRVKLDASSENDSDYINASYLNPISNLGSLTSGDSITKHLKSVATQGPLEQTRGDFWKCIFNLKASIIVSLTDEIENGVVKCSPFWKSGVYISHQDTINVVLHTEYPHNEHLTLRKFQVSMANESHEVFQIHLTSWPDMGTVLKPLDLIQILRLKSYILNHLNIADDAYPSVVHCSAGCGRTGTLCTIDTMLNIFKNNDNFELSYDPVYDIVNNFRRQRISMVQNLGQYYLIYDVILDYILSHGKEDSDWDVLCELDIVKEFISAPSEKKST